MIVHRISIFDDPIGSFQKPNFQNPDFQNPFDFKKSKVIFIYRFVFDSNSYIIVLLLFSIKINHKRAQKICKNEYTIPSIQSIIKYKNGQNGQNGFLN